MSPVASRTKLGYPNCNELNSSLMVKAFLTLISAQTGAEMAQPLLRPRERGAHRRGLQKGIADDFVEDALDVGRPNRLRLAQTPRVEKKIDDQRRPVRKAVGGVDAGAEHEDETTVVARATQSSHMPR